MIPYTRELLEKAFANMDRYVPREGDQWPSLLSKARTTVIGGGEQGGKSCNEGHFAAVYCATNFNEVVWIVSPDYKQGQHEFRFANEALSKGKMLQGVPSMPREGSWELRTITGCLLYTRTAEEVLKLAGEAPGLILMVEAGQTDFSVYEQCFGRTGGKKAQLRVSGTFEKANAWYDGLWRRGEIYPNDDDIQSFSIPSWNNPHRYPGGRDDPELKRLLKELGERTFLRRYGGQPPPLMGQVYTDFNPREGGHVCDPFEIPAWWFRYRILDAGISEQHPFCCLWTAVDEKRNTYVYRELHLKGKTIEEAAAQVKANSGKEAYRVTLIDPAAFSRSRQSGWTDAKEFQRHGIACFPANSRDTARISRVVQMFRSNKIRVFNTCPNLIRTLPLQVWDQKIGKEKRDPRIEDDPVDCLEYFSTYLGAPTLDSPKDKLQAELDDVRNRKDIPWQEREKEVKRLRSLIYAEQFWRDRKKQSQPKEDWRLATVEAP